MTDSRHYASITKQGTLRFSPHSASLKKKTLARIHGTDERISVEDFRRALCFYRQGLSVLGGLGGGEQQQPEEQSTAAAAAATSIEEL